MSERHDAIIAVLTDDWQDAKEIASAAGVDMRYGMKDVVYRVLRRAVREGVADYRRVWADVPQGAIGQWRRRP